MRVGSSQAFVPPRTPRQEAEQQTKGLPLDAASASAITGVNDKTQASLEQTANQNPRSTPSNQKTARSDQEKAEHQFALPVPFTGNEATASKIDSDEHLDDAGTASGSGDSYNFSGAAQLSTRALIPQAQKAIDFYQFTATISAAGGEGELIGVDTYA